MMYGFLKKSKKYILSLSDIVNSSLREEFVLPKERLKIIKILSSLHSTGLICLIKSTPLDTSKVWVVINKQILLAEVNGILFAPESFSEHHNVASNTGIVTLSSLTRLFPHYDPDMLICFLKNMNFCQGVNLQFLKNTNLRANADVTIEDKYYFFPVFLDVDRPSNISGQKFKFGWCLQCIAELEDYHFFPSRFLHILMLHLSYKYGLPEHSDDLSITFNRKCTFWRNGIHWFDGKGVETLVEMVDESQCILVIMSCEDGYEENMVSLRKLIIQEIKSVQKQCYPILSVSDYVIDPDELIYPIDKPTQQAVYSVADIIASIKEENWE